MKRVDSLDEYHLRLQNQKSVRHKLTVSVIGSRLESCGSWLCSGIILNSRFILIFMVRVDSCKSAEFHYSSFNEGSNLCFGSNIFDRCCFWPSCKTVYTR